MKHNKTRNALPAVAGIIGTVLATAPLAESASISPEEALEEVFPAEITGTGTWTDRVYGTRSWLTFAGMENFTYEVHAHTAPDSWTLLGTAEVIDGQGFFVVDAGNVDPDDFEVILTLYGESAPPRWPAGSAFTVVSVQPDGVEVAWDEAADDLGVAGYAVYLNGEPYATMGPAVRSIVIDDQEPGEPTELNLLALDEQGQCAQHPVTLAICAGTHLPTAPIDEAKAAFSAYLDVSYDPSLASVVQVTKQRDIGLDAHRAYMWYLEKVAVSSYDALMDVNGDGQVSPSDVLMVHSPLTTESVWDDTDIAHVITTDWDFTTYDSGLRLVGLPPGIGLTFQASDAGDHEAAALVPLPLPTGALGTTALVGVPPGIGLTFQASDGDDHEAAALVPLPLPTGALGTTALVAVPPGIGLTVKDTNAVENAVGVETASILLPAVQNAFRASALTNMPVSGESFAAFREYSLPVIVYATFMSRIGPHVDGVILSGSSAGGAGVRTNLDTDSSSEDAE